MSLISQPAQSLIRIIISSGAQDATQIAVVPFAGEKNVLGVESEFTETIRRDLSFSGRFSSIDPDDMLEQPTNGDGIDFINWQTQEIPYLVIGRVLIDSQVKPNGAESPAAPITVEFQIFDVRTEEQMAGYSLAIEAALWRRSARDVSRHIYETILNEESFFGQNLVYVKKQRDKFDLETYALVLSDLDGEELQTMYISQWPIYSPEMSIDGRRVAFVATLETSSVFIVDIVANTLTRLLPRFGAISAPAWSPDGARLAFSRHHRGNSEIYVYDIAEHTVKRVTYHLAIDTEPAWSPDGRYLYFTSDRSNGVQVYRKAYKFHSRATRMTYVGPYNASPSVAPNGRELAFVHRANGRDRIMVMNLESGLERVISKGNYDEAPSFSANSRMVMFTSERHDDKTISFADVQSASQYQFKSGNHAILDAAWATLDEPGQPPPQTADAQTVFSRANEGLEEPGQPLP